MTKLYRRDPHAVAVVTPSDQYIGNEQAFEQVIADSLVFAGQHDALLTVGITPTYPATGYGYIQTYSQKDARFTPVLRFKEKPDLRTAVSYLNEGDYYWNSGMFVWSAQTIVEALRRYLPEVISQFESAGTTYDTPLEQAAVNKAFVDSPSISIDYGVMERSDRVYVCCTNDLAWSDVGSWGALYGLLTKDEQLNAASGTEQVRFMASDGNLIKETNLNKKVVIDGLSGFLVADTEDVLMICPLGDENHLKQVIESASKS